MNFKKELSPCKTLLRSTQLSILRKKIDFSKPETVKGWRLRLGRFTQFMHGYNVAFYLIGSVLHMTLNRLPTLVVSSNLYIPSNINNWLMFRHKKWGLSTFQVFWGEMYPNWLENVWLIVWIFFIHKIWRLLDVQASLPETSPFFVCPNRILSFKAGSHGPKRASGSTQTCHSFNIDHSKPDI